MNQVYEIETQDIVGNNHEDILHVRWQLINTCNYACQYCPHPNESSDCVIVKERIMTMAYRIMEVRRPAYFITLVGGEPTLHPFLPEIVRYFLTCGRNVKLTVETNGSRDLDFYFKLIKNLPPNSFILKIFAHPQFVDAKHILMLIGLIAENGQRVHLEVMADHGQHDKLAAFMNYVIKFREYMPFELAIRSLLSKGENCQAEYNDWSRNTLKEFKNSILKGPRIQDVWPELIANRSNDLFPVDVSKADFCDLYCCTGSNLVYITSDGYFYGATCGYAEGSSKPLWDVPQDALDRLIAIKRCRNKNCMEGINNVVPKFLDEAKAQSWSAARLERQKRINWLIGPVSNPLNPEPSLEAIIRSRLKNLEPLSASAKASDKYNLEKLPPSYADICQIYSFLANDRSREIFLRELKTWESGDSMWLALSEPGALRPYTDNLLAISLASAVNTSEVAKTVIKYAIDGQDMGHCELDDLPFLLEGRYFSQLNLDLKSLELETLKKLGSLIYDYQPALLVALKGESSHIQIPLWLKENFPAYNIHLERRKDATWLRTRVRNRPPIQAASDKILSIIIYCQNNEHTIKRTLDGILLYGHDRVELIIVDDASSDDSWGIIGEYATEYSHNIRPMKISTHSGLWAALDQALQVASGEYVTLLPASGMSGERLIMDALDILEKNSADIAVFETVEYMPEAWVWTIKAGEYSGKSALEAFLLHQFGPYMPFGRVYRRQMLDRFALRFDKSNGFAGFLFDVRAFYAARKVIAINQPGYYDYEGCVFGKPDMVDLATTLDVIAKFRRWHPDAVAEDAWGKAQRSLYAENRLNLCENSAEMMLGSSNSGSLDKEKLLAIGGSKEILLALMEDCANIHPSRNRTRRRVVTREADWSYDQVNTVPPKTYIAYGNSEKPLFKNPAMSVVIPNYNKAEYLRNTLDSVLSQSMEDFELIIVDDHSTDGSYEVLQAYADQHARIRLYRMEHNCLPGVCRNLGLEKARGKYLIFVDSDDLCLPDYFGAAIDLVSANDADVAIFSTEHTDANGKVMAVVNLRDKALSKSSVMNEFYQGRLESAPCGKIYSREFLNKNKCRFVEYAYYQDAPFLLSVLSRANRIVLSSQIAYRELESRDSASCPEMISYLHLHSVYMLYCHMNREAEKYFGRNIFERKKHDPTIHVISHMENKLLDISENFLKATGVIQMSDADYTLLGKNPLFVWSLVRNFSQGLQNGELGTDNQASGRNRHKYREPRREKPLVSILVEAGNDNDELAARLDSILSQSLVNIEILIISNSYSHNMAHILESYAEKDGRINLVDIQDNKDAAQNMKLALESVCGKYIMISLIYEKFKRDLLLDAVKLLEKDAQLAHVWYGKGNMENQESKSIQPLSNVEMLKIYNLKKMADSPFGTSIFSKKYLAGVIARLAGKYIDNDILMLHLYAESPKNLLINDSCPEYADSSYAANIFNKKDIDEQIREFESLAEYLEESESLASFAEQILQERAKTILAQTDIQEKYDLINDSSDFTDLPESIGNTEYLKKYAGTSLPSVNNARINGYLASRWSYGDKIENPAESIIIYADDENIPTEDLGQIIQDGIEIVIIHEGTEENESAIYDMVQNLVAINPDKKMSVALFSTPWRMGSEEAYRLAREKARGSKISFIGKTCRPESNDHEKMDN